jgi:hypothetical protein
VAKAALEVFFSVRCCAEREAVAPGSG